MTYMSSTQSPRPLSFLRRIMVEFYQNRRKIAEQRRTVRALNGLDNRALKDLAISRSEIYSIAYANPSDRRRNSMK